MILRTDSSLRLHHAATRVFQEGEVHVTRVYSYSVLILMLEGELRFLEDGREVTLQAGEYYIQRAGLLQEGLPLGRKLPTYFYVEFSGGDYQETGEGLALSGSFSATLSFALRERGFSSSSASLGKMGFLVTILTFGFFPHTQTGKFLGQVHPDARSAKVCFTIRSSREWKVIMAILPPSRKRFTAARMAGSITSSSALTSIRNA